MLEREQIIIVKLAYVYIAVKLPMCVDVVYLCEAKY